MAVARTRSIALLGLAGSVVEVEADLSAQLPAFVIIGLPDTALGEARDRVRSAATNAGMPPAAAPTHRKPVTGSTAKTRLRIRPRDRGRVPCCLPVGERRFGRPRCSPWRARSRRAAPPDRRYPAVGCGRRACRV